MIAFLFSALFFLSAVMVSNMNMHNTAKPDVSLQIGFKITFIFDKEAKNSKHIYVILGTTNPKQILPALYYALCFFTD